ncbi:hypothetical protein IAT38_003837 [Cryptococcus sp. DSM 104549]
MSSANATTTSAHQPSSTIRFSVHSTNTSSSASQSPASAYQPSSAVMANYYGSTTDYYPGVAYSSATSVAPSSSSAYASSYSNYASYSDSYTDISSSSVVGGGSGGNSTSSDDDESGDGKGLGHMRMAVVVVVAIACTLVVVGAIFGCVLCRRRRRRRRSNTASGEAFDDKAGGKRGQGGRSAESPGTPTAHDASVASRQPLISQADTRRVVLPTTAPTTTTYPDTGFSLSPGHLASYPPSHSHPASVSPFLDPEPSPTSPSSRNEHSSSRRPESEYTDNSEYDMLAQDGSSYARTLSTYSEGVNSEYSERDLGTYAAPSQTTPTCTSTGTSTSLSRPRLEVDTKSALGPGSSEGTWSGSGMMTSSGTGGGSSGGWGYTRVGSESEPGTAVTARESMRGLVSPFADPPRRQGAPSVISDRSWRTEDETLFAGGATIVQHRDAGAVADEVHLPPAYGDLYRDTN